MLDDYKSKQPIVYKILKNAIINDKCSHAYLFETNGFTESFDFIMSFIKSLLCPNKYLNNNNCNNCHQCEVIKSGNFPEIKIINPDGLWIKKEQLQELQNEFNKKAIIGTKKVYIINHADKLNKSSANSILKFLEEPDNNIVAILITDNIYEVLETIRSRCQIIGLKSDIIKYEENSTSLENIKKTLCLEKSQDENIDIKITKVIDFVNFYEEKKLDTILYFNKIWNDYIKTKEELQEAFEIIILYYKDILNKKMSREIKLFKDNKENIEKITSKNTVEEICNKINIFMEFKQKIKYNANTNLLMDKLIITLEGGI